MPELQVNGVRLYYEAHGSGPPILCVHGAGSSALMWEAAVPRLARLGRVIAYDRRGCTRSQRPVPYDRTSVAEHADDAAALLVALAAAPAVVIGRSYGGAVATDLALRHPGTSARWSCRKGRRRACRPRAIAAELRGGPLQVDQTALAAIHQPTLLVAATHSAKAFRQATNATAAALPNSHKL